MTLRKYNKSELRKAASAQRMTQYLVNVNLKTGCFYLNDLIRIELNLTKGTEALVACNEESGIWYITFGTQIDGFKLRRLMNLKGHEDRLCFCYKKPAHRLLELVKAQIAATFVISKTPTDIDGAKWYRIMTKNPVRVS